MKSFQQIVLEEYFEPALGRATRVTLAFILPLIWGIYSHQLGPAVWMALTAQLLSNILIPGTYPLKMLVLAGAALASAVCAMLGTLVSHSWWLATGVMMALAFIGGFVRQTGSFGPGIVVAVLLLYLLTLDHPGNLTTAWHLFRWVLTGGGLAILFIAIAWLFVPFNPFRRSVALVWKALSDWLTVFSTSLKNHLTPTAFTGQATTSVAASLHPSSLDEKELAIRQAINDSMEWLSRRQALARARQNRHLYHLVELRRMASSIAQNLSALHLTVDKHIAEENFPRESLYYLLDNLARTTERIALSIITHQREMVYLSRLSVKRCQQAATVWLRQVESTYATHSSTTSSDVATWMRLTAEIFEELMAALDILDKWISQKTDFHFYLRQFISAASVPQSIPRVRFTFSLRSFVCRYALRLALSMGIGVAIYLYAHIPHGYWLAMTTMIVLQPEFGATFRKAIQRMQGTLGGVIVGSTLFFLHFPITINLLIVAICSFLMAYFIQKRYAIAAFFITIMVIALFHLLEPVTWQLGLIRLLVTIAGSGLALWSGYAFWPYWEKYRLPMLLAEAIEANHQYLHVLAHAWCNGITLRFQDIVSYRRRAEIDNHNAFLSLNRMREEPQHHQQQVETAFIFLGYQIRATRALNALSQYIRTSSPSHSNAWKPVFDLLENILLQAHAMITHTQTVTSHEAAHRVDEWMQSWRNLISPPHIAEEKQLWDILDHLFRELIGLYQITSKLQDAKFYQSATGKLSA
ncbi:MAG: FUSC family protein [Thermoflavifilum sp.]|nr:FUSC family protein [Thermoflavifilum sp.]